MLKIWINGANGRLGKAIQNVANPMEFEILKTDVDELDISDVEAVFSFGEINRPDVIINCAGVTDLEECEGNIQLAYKVNAIGAKNLSVVAKDINAKMVQISTDDVFDGRGSEPYTEFDEARPYTIYGKSKLAGENYVKEFTSRHFIIRSSWVYGEGESFVSRLLQKADDDEIISVVSDQVGSPTSATELAKFVLYIMGTHDYGTYHATCKGECSRYSFAKEILRIANKNAKIKAVPTHEAEAKDIRPEYSVLNNFILDAMGNYEFPHWRDALTEYLKGAE